MKHFAYVLYVGFDAQRNLCDKQNVLFYGTPRNIVCSDFKSDRTFRIPESEREESTVVVYTWRLKGPAK